MSRVLIGLLVIVALLVSGCAQAAQKAVEQTTGIKVDQKGETVTFQGKEGQTVTVSSEVPAELKDFPVPQGFKSEGMGSMAAGGDNLAAASWKGTAAVADVARFYKETMPQKGWKEDSAMDTGDGGLLNFSKGDTQVMVTYTKDNGGTTISVLLGNSKATPTVAAQGASSDDSSSASAKSAASGGSVASTASPTPSRPEATATPAPPALSDASAVPAELKDLPVPNGFSAKKDSTMRMAQGDKLQMATAGWFGTTSVKEVADFYKKSIPTKGWNEEVFMESEDEVFADYTKAGDANMMLTLGISKTDAGTEITMAITNNE